MRTCVKDYHRSDSLLIRNWNLQRKGLAGGKSARDKFGKILLFISHRLLTSHLTTSCSFPELAGKQKRNGIVFIDSFEDSTGIILEDFYKLRMKFIVKWFHETNLWSACRSSLQWYRVSVEEVFVIVLSDSMNLVSGFIPQKQKHAGFIRHCEMKGIAFKAGRPQDKTNSFRNPQRSNYDRSDGDVA